MKYEKFYDLVSEAIPDEISGEYANIYSEWIGRLFLDVNDGTLTEEDVKRIAKGFRKGILLEREIMEKGLEKISNEIVQINKRIVAKAGSGYKAMIQKT